jgi:hypothetical protein
MHFRHLLSILFTCLMFALVSFGAMVGLEAHPRPFRLLDASSALGDLKILLFELPALFGIGAAAAALVALRLRPLETGRKAMRVAACSAALAALAAFVAPSALSFTIFVLARW